MSPDRFHALSHVLHRDTDSLPVALHGPEAVRRSAESARRRRRRSTAAILTAVTALAVGAGAIAVTGPDPSTTSLPAKTPTATARPSPTTPVSPAATASPDPSLAEDPLAAFVLSNGDVSGGSQSLDDMTVTDSTLYASLHPCDIDTLADDVFQRVFYGAPGTEVSAQRVLATSTIAAANQVFTALVTAMKPCRGNRILDTESFGDRSEVTALALGPDVGGNGPATAVIRVGTVVSLIVRYPAAVEPVRLPLLLDEARKAAQMLGARGAHAAPVNEPVVTDIPANFRFAEEMTDPGWWDAAAAKAVTRSSEASHNWALDPCARTIQPTTGGRTAMLTLIRSSSGNGDSLQLAQHTDVATAAGVMASFRADLAACADQPIGPGGSTRLIWNVLPLEVGDDGLLAVGRNEVDGRAVDASIHAAVFRLRNAVFLSLSDVQGTVQVGQPDPGVAKIRASALDNEPLVCAIIGTCPAPPAGLAEAVSRAARDSTPASMPLADKVLLSLGGIYVTEHSRAALAKPSAWRMRIPKDGYRELCCGSVSALELLAKSRHRYVVTNGPHLRCTSVGVRTPPPLAGLRQVSIQPTDTACLDWWSVDLFLDDPGDIPGRHR